MLSNQTANTLTTSTKQQHDTVTAPIQPEILWAQRANQIFLTINVQDIDPKKLSLEFSPKTMNFQGQSVEGKMYKTYLDFYGTIDTDQIRQCVNDRQIFLVLTKTQSNTDTTTSDMTSSGSSGWWPRLLDNKKKPHYLKTDFSRWKDEDEEEEMELDEQEKLFGQADLMKNMFGGAGFAGPGMSSPFDDHPSYDSDDDEDLEEDEEGQENDDKEKGHVHGEHCQH